jgi:hypothetical protein
MLRLFPGALPTEGWHLQKLDWDGIFLTLVASKTIAV